MAIYHYSAQIIGRSQGRSAIACAAYRSGEKMIDQETGEEKDYTRKDNVDHTQVYAPENVPEWATNREQLWNEVHAVEQRKNSQFSREINVALPKELNKKEQIDLAERFAKDQFVSKGMVADVCLHNQSGENPHAHIMLTTRQIGPEGFGKKERAWNNKKLLQEQREQWAHYCNKALERSGHQAKIDHRTLEAQGIDRVPQIHRGPKPHPERLERYEAIEKINKALQELNKELAAASAKIGHEPQQKKVIPQVATHAEAVRRTKGLELKLETLTAQQKKAARELEDFKKEREKGGLLGKLNVMKNKRDNTKQDELEQNYTDLTGQKAQLEKDIATSREVEKVLWKQERPERERAAQAKDEVHTAWKTEQKGQMQRTEPYNAVKAEADRERWIEKNVAPEKQKQAKKEIKTLEDQSLTPEQAIAKTEKYFEGRMGELARISDKKLWKAESRKLEKEMKDTVNAGRKNPRFTPDHRKTLRKGVDNYQKQIQAMQKTKGISLGLGLGR